MGTGIRWRGGVVALALLFAACSHRTLQVDRALLLPPGAERHEVESDQRFLMAVPISDPDPMFPIGARLDAALHLCAAFVVAADGTVSDVVVDREGAGCADPGDATAAPFARATIGTLRGWRYFGAAICTFPDGADPDADPRCDGDGVRAEAVPIRLRYVFTFSSGRGGRVSRSPPSPTAH